MFLKERRLLDIAKQVFLQVTEMLYKNVLV